MIRTAKPLTVKEKAQLDKMNRAAARPARQYVVMGGLGFVGGAGLGWWVMQQALASGGTSTIGDGVPFLRGVEAVLGPLATGMLVGGVIVAAGMLVMAWRVAGVLRTTRNGLHARYLAAGAEGEAPR